jgi:putative oxidoreductase
MADLQLLPKNDSPNVLTDWLIRGSVAVGFLWFGLDKFPSHPGSQWVVLFQQIGFGAWFRYFTGCVEVLGAVLVLIPRAARAGLILLNCTMAAATLIVAVVLKKPGDAVFPGIILLVVAAVTAWRWNHDAEPPAESSI